jgi:ubiquinone/menaquinone biosynthesis C-methylase UbiE
MTTEAEATLPSQLSDQRTLQRLQVQLVVRDAQRSATLGLTRDLSVDGFFVQTERRLPVGTMAPVALAAEGGREIRAEAEVVRWADDGMGMRFASMDREATRALRRLVADHTSIAAQRRTALQLHDATLRQTEPVDDPGRIESLLQEAMRSGVDVRLIPPAREVMVEGRLVEVSTAELRLQTRGRALVTEGEDVLALLTMSYVSYSFSSRVVSVTDQALTLQRPSRVVFSERRRNDRLPAAGEVWLQVTAPWDSGQVLRWPVVDVSTGGVGLQVPRSAGTLFAGTPLPGAMLVQGGQRTPLEDAVVRNVRPDEGPDGVPCWRVGVSVGARSGVVQDTRTQVREEDPATLLARVGRRVRDLRTAAEFLWLTKVLPRFRTATGAAPPREGTRSIHFRGARGLTVRGLMDRAFDDEDVPRCPVLIVVPGFAGRKEQVSYLAHIVCDHFRRQHRDMVVIRLDGTNNLGESDKDPGMEGDGRHNMHYTVSGAGEDLLDCLRWLRRGEVVQATDVSVMSVSFSSVAVRCALASGRAPEVRRWIAWMGAADARDAVLHVSGHFDVFAAAQAAAARGERLGTVTLEGCVVDAQHFYEDLVTHPIGTLDDARREMARIDADVFWLRGSADAWMDPRRIEEVMAVPAAGQRRLLTMDSGHMPTSGPEAIRQFSAITGWLHECLLGSGAEVRPPSMAWLEARHALEWQRVRRAAPRDRAGWWRDYLLEEDGPGFDVLQHSTAYRTFMEEQSRQARPEGLRVLELGAGTGNLTAALMAKAPASLVVTDLVPEAVARLAELYRDDPRVTCHVVDLEGSPWLGLRRLVRGTLPGGLPALLRRLPGAPADAWEHLQGVDPARLQALVHGWEMEVEALGLGARTPAHVLQMLRDLQAMSRHLLQGTPDGEGPSLQVLEPGGTDQRMGLPFEDGAFDLVALSLVLSYLAEPMDALSEIRRVLRPGGRLLMSTMRRDADSSRVFLDLVEHFERGEGLAGTDEATRQSLLAAARRFLDRAADLFRAEEEGLYRFWDAEAFKDLAQRAGFGHITITPSFGDPSQAVILHATRMP